MKDMGKVIGVLRGKYAGQMDFGKASGLVKAKLAGPGTLLLADPLPPLGNNSRQPVRPNSLAGFVGDQILANFNGHMREAAALAVHRDRVVGVVIDAVGLVVAEGEIAGAAKSAGSAAPAC